MPAEYDELEVINVVTTTVEPTQLSETSDVIQTHNICLFEDR